MFISFYKGSGSEVYAAYSGGYRVWVRTQEILDVMVGLGRLAGADVDIHVIDDIVLDALGPVLGPIPPPIVTPPVVIPPVNPPTIDRVVLGHINTAQRATSVAINPTGSGITRIVSGSPMAIQVAINTAKPGDVVLITGGTYRSPLSITCSGTKANPIVIRSTGATWANGQWLISGSHVHVRDVTFTQKHADAIKFVGDSTGCRVHTCTFDAVGANTDASIDGIIKVDPGVGYNTGTGFMPDIDRDLLIDSCTFNNSRNCVLYTWPGNQRVDFMHNLVNGTGMSPTRESECLKYGNSGRSNGPENANSRVMFNSILGWRGTPYTIGFKMPYIRMVGNIVELGRLELRGGGRYRVIANVFLDGDMVFHDTNNYITKNWCRCTTSYYGLGGMNFQCTCAHNGYAEFTKAFTDSIVEDNVVQVTAGSEVWGPFWARAEYNEGVSERPNGNTIRRNLWWKGNDVAQGDFAASTVVADTGGSGAGGPSTQQFFDQNTWVANRVGWAHGTATAGGGAKFPEGIEVITAAPTEIGAPPILANLVPADWA